MLRSMRECFGYAIRATDGDLGRVVDFYFDDQAWRVRYLAADTGAWMPERQVLISPAAFAGKPNWESRAFPVALTRQMVWESPPIDSGRPVSRQQEESLARYFQWPMYWRGALPAEDAARITASGEPRGDPHLRGFKEVTKYHIQTLEDEVGRAEDFIFDDETWMISYLVVDTRNWFPGKKVLVAPQWVDGVDWAQSRIFTDLESDILRNSPQYDPGRPVNREFEERLYESLGRPKYWS